MPIEATLKVFSKVLRAATAAQVLAFTAYNAVLAAEADRTLTAADSEDRGDDTYGLKTALDEGMKIYEAALSLSVITAAASLTLAAVQARWLRARPLDPTTPDIEVSRSGIFLRYGANGIEIKPTGVRIVGLVGGVMIGGVSVTNVAPAAINHAPVPPIIPLVPRTI